MKCSLYYRRASSDPANYIFNLTSTKAALCWRITGVVPTGDPQDGTLVLAACNGTGATNTQTCGSIVTGSANAAVIQVSANIVTVSWVSSTLAFREQQQRLCAAGDIQAAAGSSGSKSTVSTSSHYSMSVLIALKPVVVETDYTLDKWWRETNQPPAHLRKNRIVGY
jgi:hypothetical protein